MCRTSVPIENAEMDIGQTDAAFHAVADDRWAAFLATGQSVGWEESKAWLAARAQGQHLPRPTPRRLKI